MSDLFAKDLMHAIDQYRLYLRRNYTQADRVAKLRELGLKLVNFYSDPVDLHRTGMAIVKDIQDSVAKGMKKGKIAQADGGGTMDKSYYAYSGIERFGQYLNDYLSKYEINDGKVVHSAQKASRAILEAIQSVNGLTQDKLTDELLASVMACHPLIVRYGLPEQFDIYRENLEQLKPNSPEFFNKILADFEQAIESSGSGMMLEEIEAA